MKRGKRSEMPFSGSICGEWSGGGKSVHDQCDANWSTIFFFSKMPFRRLVKSTSTGKSILAIPIGPAETLLRINAAVSYVPYSGLMYRMESKKCNVLLALSDLMSSSTIDIS